MRYFLNSATFMLLTQTRLKSGHNLLGLNHSIFVLFTVYVLLEVPSIGSIMGSGILGVSFVSVTSFFAGFGDTGTGGVLSSETGANVDSFMLLSAPSLIMSGSPYPLQCLCGLTDSSKSPISLSESE
jgi:hypothetical protein